MQTNVIEKIKLALSKTLENRSLENIPLSARLREDLGLDSMTSLTFLMTLEETIEGFVVDPETLEAHDLECVETVLAYVKKRIEN